MRKITLIGALVVFAACAAIVPDFNANEHTYTKQEPHTFVRLIPFGTFCADSFDKELGKEYRTVMVLVDRVNLEPAEIVISVSNKIQQQFRSHIAFRLDFRAGVGQHHLTVSTPEGDIRKSFLVYPKVVCR